MEGGKVGRLTHHFYLKPQTKLKLFSLTLCYENVNTSRK